MTLFVTVLTVLTVFAFYHLVFLYFIDACLYTLWSYSCSIKESFDWFWFA